MISKAIDFLSIVALGIALAYVYVEWAVQG